MNGLADILKECGAIKFGDFTLASGKKSNFYIDIKKASMNPEVLKMIACRVRNLMETRSISGDYIACMALGGVPIAVAVSLETGLPLVIIRKESKEYGAKGHIVGEIEKGRSAIVVEDVTTTGGSILKAIKILRDEELVINHVITVVDRDEGAFKNLADANVRLTALVSIKELVTSSHQ